MKTKFAPLDSLRRGYLTSNHGWTGIEIGCHAVSFAQVRKCDGEWQLSQFWKVEHPVPYAITREDYSGTGVRSLWLVD